MIDFWVTYDNRIVKMEEMNHQHMSNIYYYINTIVPGFYNNEIREYINEWLVKRFAGVILPYRPVPKFRFEKVYLSKMGYTQENNDIVIGGVKIGSYE